MTIVALNITRFTTTHSSPSSKYCTRSSQGKRVVVMLRNRDGVRLNSLSGVKCKVEWILRFIRTYLYHLAINDCNTTLKAEAVIII